MNATAITTARRTLFAAVAAGALVTTGAGLAHAETSAGTDAGSSQQQSQTGADTDKSGTDPAARGGSDQQSTDTDPHGGTPGGTTDGSKDGGTTGGTDDGSNGKDGGKKDPGTDCHAKVDDKSGGSDENTGSQLASYIHTDDTTGGGKDDCPKPDPKPEPKCVDPVTGKELPPMTDKDGRTVCPTKVDVHKEPPVTVVVPAAPRDGGRVKFNTGSPHGTSSDGTAEIALAATGAALILGAGGTATYVIRRKR